MIKPLSHIHCYAFEKIVLSGAHNFVTVLYCYKKVTTVIIVIITPHVQRERGKVIGRGVHIYIYIYIYMSVVEKKICLEIDSPFQTLTVGLLIEFID